MTMTDETQVPAEGTNAAEAQVQVAAPAEQTQAPQKPKKSGDLIQDIAVEIAGLSKIKALNLAEKLSTEIETDHFRLGGVLKMILDQQWYEGFPTFDAFVLEKFGFAVRKAHYLIEIYTHLVDKQIPWEKVSGLGWTKLKDLAKHLTAENVDEWVAKATPVTVAELQAMLKPQAGTTESTKTTSDVVKLQFKLHQDQAEQVNSALAKAKGELQTDHDNTAIAAICGGYLSNAQGVQTTGGGMSVEAFKAAGYVAVLALFEQAFPEINLDVKVPEVM
jgi:hypothetical protein